MGMSVLFACLIALASRSDALATASTGTTEGAVVRRRIVTAPEPVVPPGFGAKKDSEPVCAGRSGGPPKRGDEIRLWLSPRAARKDAGGVSLILRLDDAESGVAYVLFHEEKAYSELRYPPKPKELWSTMRRQMAKAGVDWEQLHKSEISAPPQSTPVTVRGLAATEYRWSTSGRLGATSDAVRRVMVDPQLGPIAFRLEALMVALSSGDLLDSPRVGGTDEIVLETSSVSRWLDNPPNERVEQLVAFERQSLAAATFSAPASYKKIRFSPDCFVGIPSGVEDRP